MIYSKDTSYNSEILKALQSLEACVKTCVSEIRSVRGFQHVCAGIIEDVLELNNTLNGFVQKYSNQMPIYKHEPHDVKWLEWAKLLRDMSNQIERCPRSFPSRECANANDYQQMTYEKVKEHIELAPFGLISMLKGLAVVVDSIDTILNSYSSPELYVDYCKAEQQNYNTTSWLADQRPIIRTTNMQTESALYDYCIQQAMGTLKELAKIKADLACLETQSVNYEAVGRYIWGCTHQEEDQQLYVCDILKLINSVEFYQTKANRCQEHVSDPQLIHVHSYVQQMQKYTTDAWKQNHNKLWTKILVNKELSAKFKDVGRAKFKLFSIPYVHNVICTLRNLGVYQMINKKTSSIASINRDLYFEGKGEIGDHRTSLNKEVDDASMIIIRDIVTAIKNAA